MKEAYKKPIVIGVLFLTLFFLLRYTSFDDYLTFEQLKANRQQLRLVVDQNYWLAVAIYCTVFVLTIGCAIPAIAPLALVGGFLFGAFFGTLYALASALLGVLISFMLIRYLLASTIRGKYQERLTRFKEKISQYGALYLITLQFLTVVPYFVINTLAALADVPLATVMWTTAVGSIPSLFVYALVVRQLCKIESIYDIFSFEIILVFILLIVLALMPLFIRTIRERMESS